MLRYSVLIILLSFLLAVNRYANAEAGNVPQQVSVALMDQVRLHVAWKGGRKHLDMRMHGTLITPAVR